MIDSQTLLKDLKRLLSDLQKDIRGRLEVHSALDEVLRAEWQQGREAKRTAATFLEWREEEITQAGVHWILACVFLRFLEDNGYLERPFLFGATPAAQALARDRHESYFRAHPSESDREYLVACFAEAARLPGLSGLYDPKHNPLFRLGVSGDGAIQLREFWQRIDTDSGQLLRDFSDPDGSTRFLGDLYQDLSESARERFALLQTPDFVEEFILDRTLTPALETFGYKAVRLIDPTCGSGHFLLGTFHRLFNLWASKEPARNLPDLAQQALNGVYGVDLNPFAVEIARFRLLIASIRACGVRRLQDAPDFRINLATGDSLLHGSRFGLRGTKGMFDGRENYAGTSFAHAYESEDLPELQRILGQQYHAVVGNPPYITPKDVALRAKYRERYISCYRKYSLGVAFTERFFELAIPAHDSQEAGYIGLIVTNSFMRREFGIKLIEEFLPTVDLTHIIDSSGVPIPGHGTPTVILFGRSRRPVADSVRAVIGVKGGIGSQNSSGQSRVWQALITQVDQVPSESEYFTVTNAPRRDFARHPWSIGGSDAAELTALISQNSSMTVDSLAESIGFGCIISEEDAFQVTRRNCLEIERAATRRLVIGDNVRDWHIDAGRDVIFPYDSSVKLVPLKSVERALWWARSVLSARRDFGDRTYAEVGRAWWGYHQIPAERNRTPLCIAFAFVVSHNHFVLSRGDKIFGRTAPVIKLPEEATEGDYLQLLGLLNSSTACFWLKQICFNKGMGEAPWADRYEHDGSKVGKFPLSKCAPVDLTMKTEALAEARARFLPAAVVRRAPFGRNELSESRRQSELLLRQLIGAQEELDWWCYRAYGIIDGNLCLHGSPPELSLGERAFEIVLARRVARGEEETRWFERHRSKPITELPSHWSEHYRSIVERRIALIESDRHIGLIERPEYKRRWNTVPWEEQEQHALREWLLDRLETEGYWSRSGTVQLGSAFQLADLARADPQFMQVATLYTGRDDFDVTKLVVDLVESEAVPYLAALRYTDDGLRKRSAWEETWALQRQEDAVDAQVAAITAPHASEPDEKYQKRLAAAQRAARLQDVGEVPVPPKYKSSDFRNAVFWRLRGALDVPKERFVSYPQAAPGADDSLVLGWAGWDNLQQSQALAGHYLTLKEREGWGAERLTPLLAGLLERVPWLKQWHNELDPDHGARMGDYFEGFVQDEARSLALTLDDLRAWRPPAAVSRRRRAAGG